MKISIYPGSFNPWHDGHEDVLQKALKVFDRVVIAKGLNPDKIEFTYPYTITNAILTEEIWNKINSNVHRTEFVTSLSDFIKTVPNSCAIIKGLRNAQDLEYETIQQYWNEDLGIEIPTFYVITDRKLRHISSSAIRAVEKFKNE